MTQVVIVYWRDIPAQVIVGPGRKAAKRELDARFQEAIDQAAMRAKAIGTDAYLEDWRREPQSHTPEGDQEVIAETVAARLEGEFDSDRLSSLVDNMGYAAP